MDPPSAFVDPRSVFVDPRNVFVNPLCLCGSECHKGGVLFMGGLLFTWNRVHGLPLRSDCSEAVLNNIYDRKTPLEWRQISLQLSSQRSSGDIRCEETLIMLDST